MDLPRSSGVLLHISSLSTPFGVGDFGPSAYRFADFLHASGIHFWQTLPLNYTTNNSGYSPYSCLSAFAGNPLFISPEWLVKDNLLKAEDITHTIALSDKVDFDKASYYKYSLYDKAFEAFKKTDQTSFQSFCKKQKHWLNDFALFIALKNQRHQAWWIDWPAGLKNRDPKALKEISVVLKEDILKEKFLQYLFFQQLQELRNHCAAKKIRLIGDMPFYVSHDSADVWTAPQYFKLYANGRPKKVCGVPPDMFSETGQLWGMPVFNWTALKKDGYRWWIQRIQQTLTMCDIVRLDHFRAFSAYWEVEASEKTAEHGKWIKGPGRDFFVAVRRSLPELPFIAEDLGEIDQPVWDLMDEFHLPGMKILQFAFVEHVPESIHSPHHHVPYGIVYTGTHDNNTVRGWYENELGDSGKENISAYLDKPVNAANVAAVFVRLANSSVSQVAIWPIQDLFDLGKEGLMNRPGTLHGNWTWSMSSEKLLTTELAEKIREELVLFNRIV